MSNEHTGLPSSEIQTAETLDEEQELLPVSDALQVIYCPRNFYYRYVAGVDDLNAAMLKGSIEENNRSKRQTIYRTGAVQFRENTLVSREMGLIGRVDMIEETPDGPVPVENKTGDMKENPYDYAQLCAYGMMLEELRGVPVLYGFLYYTGSKKRVRVDFTDELRQKVQSAVEIAWTILEGDELPPPLDDPRCRGCALAETCMPDEVTELKGKKDECKSGVAPRCTFERTVFIDEGWGSIGIRDNVMTIKKGDEKRGEVPLNAFDQVFLLGQVNISGALFKEFFRRNVFVAFFNARGRFEGSLSPEKTRYVALRKAQFRVSESDEERMVIARELVDAKLANMRVLIRRQSGKLEDGNETLMDAISALRKEIMACKDYHRLLGIEGAGSRAYFQGYRKQFGPEWKFERRTKRPPKDPVNAALSFGYSILAGQLVGLIQAVGLDPYIGFLHREKYGNPCLALDLMEVFRSVIVDSVVLRMFSTGMVNPDSFDMPNDRSIGCYLNEKGREAFFRAFTQRMAETATHPVFQVKLNYRRLLEMEVRFLAKYLVGEIERFTAYRVR